MKNKTSAQHTIPGFETRTNIGLNPLSDPSTALARQEKKEMRSAAKEAKKESKRLAKKRRDALEPVEIIIGGLLILFVIMLGFTVWAITNYVVSGGPDKNANARISTDQIVAAQELYSQVNGSPESPAYGSLEELKAANLLPLDFNSGEHGDAAINLMTGERADGAGEWFSVTSFAPGFMTYDYEASSHDDMEASSVDTNMSYEEAVALYGTGK